jgi:hypothetical protein
LFDFDFFDDFLAIIGSNLLVFLGEIPSRMLDLIEKNGVLDQIIDASFSLLQLVWL